MPPVRAIVSLGSNIEPRAEYLARAREALSAMPETRIAGMSSVEETDPVGVPDEFAHLKFLNQLIVLQTGLDVHDFSRRMHAVENALGRVRTVKNGPRTIDIDLIDFGGIRLDEPGGPCRKFVIVHNDAGSVQGDVLFIHLSIPFVKSHRIAKQRR